MPRKKTNEEFKSEVNSLVGNEYTILGEYKNSKTKIEIRHNLCNHLFKMAPNKFLSGQRCPNCKNKTISKSETKSTQHFKSEVYNLVDNEYTVLGKYKSAKTKIKMKHNKCGNIYEVSPDSFLHGSRCPECSKNHKKSTQQFKAEVCDLVGDEYTVLCEYKGARIKIKMKHNKCDYEYKVEPNAFLHGRRCPKCSSKANVKHRTKTNQEFKQEVYNLVGDEYKLVSKYYNAKTKVKLLHKKCGKNYSVRPNDFIHNHNRCNCESNYKNENKIANYLDNYNIEYSRQKTFPWLKFKDYQFLDFYLPDYNLAIEYDGEQHFQAVRRSIKEDNQTIQNRLKENQLRDRNKNKLCYQHGIKVLRIPYWKKNNIESILNKELNIK